MPQDQGSFELVKGEHRCMTPAGYEHGRIAGNLASLVGQFVKSHALGDILTAEAGFILALDPDTVRAPNLAFVSKDRLPSPEERKGFSQLAPDLVVEVVSPTGRSADVEEKIQDYLKAGVSLLWTVYPDTRTVTEYRSVNLVRVLSCEETLDGHDVLPGFRCRVAAIFA